MPAITSISSRSMISPDSFPDPWADVASQSLPDSFRNALKFCEFIFLSNGTYRMAMERVISYFLTDIEFAGDGEDPVDDGEEKKWGDFLRRTLGIHTFLQDVLRDRQAYGNSFASVLVPFKRYLACPKCGTMFPLHIVYNNPIFAFDWSGYQFIATCPSCKTGGGYHGPWRVDDKPDDAEKKIRLKRWSPHEIELLHDYYSDDVAYLWRIPDHYKYQVRRGNLYHLERATLPVIDAIKHNQVFRFNDDAVFHMKEPTLGGVVNRGWGMPRTLSNYRQIYYVQVLRRMNEAIALDYVTPFRLLTPLPRPGTSGRAGDALMGMAGGDFVGQVNRMLRRRRRDPASWFTLPFPVQYNMIGAEANQLAPKDLLDQGNELLLNDSGIPVDLYKGSLQLQAAPPALRLFEATWHHLVRDTNSALDWLVRQLSQILSWEALEARMKRVTIADDINRQMAILQLMMGQAASGTTALAGLGMDWKQEQRRLSEEARFQAEQQNRVQEEMDQSGFASQIAKGMITPGGGGAPAATPGGSPTGGGGDPASAASPAGGGAMAGPVSQYIASQGPNTPVQPTDLVAAADSIAQQMLGMPEGVKNSEMSKLKKHNEVLHAIVTKRIEAIRADAKNRGGAQMMSQTYGGGGGQPPPQ